MTNEWTRNGTMAASIHQFEMSLERFEVEILWRLVLNSFISPSVSSWDSEKTETDLNGRPSGVGREELPSDGRV